MFRFKPTEKVALEDEMSISDSKLIDANFKSNIRSNAATLSYSLNERFSIFGGFTYSSFFAAGNITSITATNLGTTNGGQRGDVLIGYFNPLLESYDGPDYSNELYFMITNGLSDRAGSGAQCRQRITLNFHFKESGIKSVQRLSRTSGKVEEVAVTAIEKDPGRYLLSRSRGPELVQESDIFEFTLDSEPVVPPKVRLYSERVIHGCIYQARPDVMAVVHHHAAAVMPFAQPVFQNSDNAAAGHVIDLLSSPADINAFMWNDVGMPDSCFTQWDTDRTRHAGPCTASSCASPPAIRSAPA